MDCKGGDRINVVDVLKRLYWSMELVVIISKCDKYCLVVSVVFRLVVYPYKKVLLKFYENYFVTLVTNRQGLFKSI